MTAQPFSKEFGERVRELREAKGISLRKFADKLKISPTYLSKVERGDFPPPAEERIIAIAKELGQDADELLALAGKVAPDLSGIIQQHPKKIASFLRTLDGRSEEEIERLMRDTDKGQPPR